LWSGEGKCRRAVLLGESDEAMRRFLFVCLENAGRSQMAEAFAKMYGLDAASAGTVPSKTVNPTVVEVMQEKGLDLSGSTPKVLSAANG
jgi:protein-tyrosine-phosphatase